MGDVAPWGNDRRGQRLPGSNRLSAVRAGACPPRNRRWRGAAWMTLLAAVVGCGGGALNGPGAAPVSGGLRAPAGSRPTKINPAGETVLPNGRILTPRGVLVRVAPHPYGLALSPDGQTLVTANSGTAPFSVSILTNLASPRPTVAQIPPGFTPSPGDPPSVYLGVAIARDNRTLYVSEGNNGRIGVFDLATRRRIDSLSLDQTLEGRAYRDSLTGEIQLSRDGRFLYALDLAHYRLVIFDTARRRMLASLPVGRLPFGLALSPDDQWAYVSNVGMFQYSLVPGYDPRDPKDTGIDFPPFGFPSPAADVGAMVSGKRIPGLGDPNSPGSNCVWVIDVSIPSQPEVRGKIPTGLPVGPESVGGSSPGGVVAGHKSVYVSNATQDSISIIDARTWRVKRTVRLEPAPSVKGLRGVLPFGLALSPDEKRLYVACAGINAVAVLDARKGKVLGYLPAGWFPARLQISHDGKTLYVANAKGFGAGPNGGPDFHRGPEGTYIGAITRGVVSIVRIPEPRTLKDETARVLLNNGLTRENPVEKGGAEAPAPFRAIRHVVVIVKENRTFDQVYGDLPSVAGEPVNGDPELAEYGDEATVKAESEEPAQPRLAAGEAEGSGTPPTVEHARVSPNHHALAERFGLSDNYYVDGDVSVDGHHWLVGNYPNEMFESAWPAAYGGQFDFKPDPDAAGRLGVGATSPWPETYLEAGSLWEHLARHQITFRNYGEGLEMAGDDEEAGLEPTGVREAINMPMPEPLFENTSRTYPTFNTNISDQYRFEQFRREFAARYASGREALPQLIFIWLPQDHTADPRPADGYPYRASYVADNDLALGKFVQLFSHSAYWRDMAIFVTEDDAQDGTDHVDAHRSILLVVSPYSRRGVSHVHTSMESILKTIDEIFGLGYLNQYDAAATDLSDRFTSRPDFTPYDPLPPDRRLFDPSRVIERGLEPGAGRTPSAPLDDPARIRRELDGREP